MTSDSPERGMATIQIGALALVLWCGFVLGALVLWSPFPLDRSPLLAFLIALIGLVYAVPTVVYLMGIDMLARRLPFPWSSAMFAVAVGAWLAASFLALRSHGGAFAWICTGACLPGICLFLRRQVTAS